MVGIAGITNMTDASVEWLAKRCDYLTEISLSGCMMISPQMINFLHVCLNQGRHQGARGAVAPPKFWDFMTGENLAFGGILPH